MVVTRIGSHRWRAPLASLLLAVGLAAPGCSEGDDELPREPVWGSVTLDGQPMAAGTIQFSPAAAGAGTAAPIQGGGKVEGGQFSIPREQGLVPGPYKVSISSSDRRDRTKPAMPGKASALAKELVPAKYNAKSTLTAEIKKGGTPALKFELQSK